MPWNAYGWTVTGRDEGVRIGGHEGIGADGRGVTALSRTHHRLDALIGVLAILATVIGAAGAAWASENVLAPAATISRAPDLVHEFLPGKVTPLAHGHAHNDYLHAVPLAEALEHGFTSVEVDVVLFGDQLLVGHDILDAVLRYETLTDLYLGPLKGWIIENEGKVFADPKQGFTLVIDVKSAPGATYKVLDEVLARYQSMLTRFTRESVQHGPVTVVVSGYRAEGMMAAQSLRYAAYDGRTSDLDSSPGLPVAEMPMVSDSWEGLFGWNGVGTMPADQKTKLDTLVAKAHQQGRRLRLYDTPATSSETRLAVWKAEMAAHVDLLNIDDLPDGKAFLLSYKKPSKPYVPW